MRLKSAQELSLLQEHPENIRNVCILAHVDHGKTTLADTLIASNGIISHQMSGKMRYMDDRDDEQERGITLKSSAISLYYQNDMKEYLINLIDSPGHVDFSSEVSTAVRLCDGALILVDVVEGVCPQTHAVMHQVWLEKIRPVLVLNKIDRLITQLKMTSLQSFYHLQSLLVQVNLLMNQLFTSEAMGRREMHDEWTTGVADEEQRDVYFAPGQRNVIFASALNRWGFTVSDFASMYCEKLGFSHDVLEKTLWGDYYVKSKRILKGAQSKGKKPLFVHFVLDNIWAVYDAVLDKGDRGMRDKIISALGLSICHSDLQHNDTNVQLCAVMSQWLPISSSLLRVVVEQIPSPRHMSEERVERLMCGHSRQMTAFPVETRALKSEFLCCSSSDDATIIVFISKMMPMEHSHLVQSRSGPLSAEERQAKGQWARDRYLKRLAGDPISEHENNGMPDLDLHGSAGDRDGHMVEEMPRHKFVAFARIFSGRLSRGQRLYVLGPKYNPVDGLSLAEDKIYDVSGGHVSQFTVDDIYMFMGRELERLTSVPAGNVLGIGGLENLVLKSATVSSSLACPAFTDLYFDATPIIKVAIEPTCSGNMNKLVDGLRLLNLADPCVQVMVHETGEHVIVTAGEVHLQRCIDDLRLRYARVDINVSEPIVPFRETVVVPCKPESAARVSRAERPDGADGDAVVLGQGLVEVCTANGQNLIRLRLLPLPEAVVNCLCLREDAVSLGEASSDNEVDIQPERLAALRQQLDSAFQSAGPLWDNAVDQIWAFGPRCTGPNLLLNRVPSYRRPSMWGPAHTGDRELEGDVWDNDSSIVAGFRLATHAGPLCHEPMHGICYIVERWDTGLMTPEHSVMTLDSELVDPCCSGGVRFGWPISHDGCLSDGDRLSCPPVDSEMNLGGNAAKVSGLCGPLSGQLVSAMKEACRTAFQSMPQRLMVAVYRCTIQVSDSVLGKLYAVIGKRNGRVIEEELMEGTQVFRVKTEIPLVDSFGLIDEMRKRTSGLARPQLFFSHWETLDVDPFWVPSTDEEYVHFGEKSDCENRAQLYLNQVRRRKGMKINKNIVRFAEKQRTLTRNK